MLGLVLPEGPLDVVRGAESGGHGDWREAGLGAEVGHERTTACTDPHHGHEAVRVPPPDHLHLGLGVGRAADDVEGGRGEVQPGVTSPVEDTAPPAPLGGVPHVVPDLLNTEIS